MNRQGVLALLVLVAACGRASADLLRNESFEQQGSSADTAQYWEIDNPDSHGGWWGSATRVNWRSYDATWEGAIRGTWAGFGGNGGLWQEHPCNPQSLYQASAWFWADHDWSSSGQGLAIEFYDSSLTIISSVTNAFSDVGESWVHKTVQGQAPPNAAWVRVVISANGAGGSGSLQFDLVDLQTVAGNALENPSFEYQGTTSADARYWEFGNPDAHGGRWDSAERENWRAHTGAWEAAIRGTWAGAGTDGGLFQERVGAAGQTYVAGAWLWADTDWSSASQTLAIEFYDATTALISSVSSDLGALTNDWRWRAVGGVAPAGTAFARAVLSASGEGPNGSLQLDDIALQALSGNVLYWKNEATSGFWNDTHWYDSTRGVDNYNPNTDSGLELLFANDNQAAMTNDFSGPGASRWRIRFVPSTTISRVIDGTTENAFYDNAGATPKIENNVSALQTINFPIKIGTSVGLELNPVDGDLALGGAIDNNGNDLHVWGNNSKLLTLGGVVSGAGKLIVEQSSKARVTAASTFTGNVEINAGEFWVDAGGAVGSGTIYVGNGLEPATVAKLWLAADNGGLSLDNRSIIVNPANANTKFIGGLNGSGTNSYGGTVTLNATVSLEANQPGGTVEFANSISGAQDVILDGPGTVRLTAANTFGGILYIDNGTLELAEASGDPLAASEIKLGTDTGGNAATLNLNATAGFTLDNPINVRTGTGGQKTLANLAGANTCSGSVYLDSDLVVSCTGGTLTFSGTDFDLKQKVLIITGADDTTIGAGLKNSTGFNDQFVVKQGRGALIGSGNGDFGGGIYVDEGTLRLDHNHGIGTGTIRLGKVDNSALDATLLLNGGRTVANTINVRQPNSGTITIGSLDTINDNTLTGNITLDKDATFTVPGGRTLTVMSGVVNGVGGLTKIGAGTLVLAGANTYGGTTTLTEGVLRQNGTNTDSAVVVGAGATLTGCGAVADANVTGEIAPGAGVGVLGVSALTLNNGSTFRCEIGDASGNTDCDRIVCSGSATFNAGATVAVDSAAVSNWDSAQSRTWTIVAGGVSGSAGLTLDADTDWSPAKGGGQFSLAASGGNLLLTFTPVPQGVSASDGTSTNLVTVQWSDGDGETGYKLYRNASNTHVGESQIGGTLPADTTSYDDNAAVVGQSYYYWVKAVTTEGDTDYSAPDTGFRGTPGPATPATVVSFK